ncbi:MAG: hypothetical protein QXO01_01070 [Nitrososphaerota archaeon]
MVSKKAFSKTVAVIAIVVIIIAVAAAAYFLIPKTIPPTQPPTPTPTPTPSPTPTPTPTPTKPVLNFRVGAYSEYLVKTLTDEGMVELTYKMSVDGEESYGGKNCWILTLTYVQEETKMIIYVWINKIEYEVVHILMRMYENDKLIMEQELDPEEAAQNLPHPVDLQYITSYETLTVRAGTFVNCLRVETEKEGVLSKVWVHERVPIFGVVKAEIFEDGKLMSSMELISYGG